MEWWKVLPAVVQCSSVRHSRPRDVMRFGRVQIRTRRREQRGRLIAQVLSMTQTHPSALWRTGSGGPGIRPKISNQVPQRSHQPSPAAHGSLTMTYGSVSGVGGAPSFFLIPIWLRGNRVEYARKTSKNRPPVSYHQRTQPHTLRLGR